MSTSSITINTMMEILDNDLHLFDERICNGVPNAKNTFFCYLKNYPPYVEYVKDGLTCLNDREKNAAPFFLKATHILFVPSYDRPSNYIYWLTESMSRFIALYIYCSRGLGKSTADIVPSVQEIIDTPYTQNDALNDAEWMATTYGSVYSKEALKIVCLCIGKLMILRWSYLDTTLVDAQEYAKQKLYNSGSLPPWARGASRTISID